jgi:DNA-binding MarR family transcriptional regulator
MLFHEEPQVVQLYRESCPAFARHLDVSQARLQLLAELFNTEEVNQAELHQRLMVDGAAITRQVKQLEGKGFINRRADPHDNRLTLASLTEEERTIVARLIATREEFETTIMHGLSDEETAMLRDSFGRMQQNMQQKIPREQ